MSTAPAASVCFTVAALCEGTVDAALAHLTSAAGFSQWSLGMQQCREEVPGLLHGRSSFDGSTNWVRTRVERWLAHVDAPQSAGFRIDYLCGSNPDQLALRIAATIAPGAWLGYASGAMVTLLAWRTAGMSDQRWQQLIAAHETEIELIRTQLAGIAAGSKA
ncbi:MAG: hypothetical protein J0H09_17060 [Burkholderiales bacterium]|nr:hypothetical protein [Burkholderiales bacterium]